MWQTETIIFTWIPFVVASFIYQFKIGAHFQYLKMAYGSFEGYKNYLHYELTKMRSDGKKNIYDTIQIAFPIFSRDREAERANPKLKQVGKRAMVYTMLTWISLSYIFLIGFNSTNRIAISDFIKSFF